ncbi:hypothetical protein IFM61606_00752 [Aspergillus udagawae]|uniref:Methyltransferase n=1 Tax=Aspergillus udagawae TaxID=91492 RepID=A0ABQ1AMC2_9EURO|nr:hypothetical protein IFM51744_03251 [Aspergillus udagawae]GFF84571.1 hypothetical protein IFM53868_04188 [Aspergillus udagawae]GFG20736.1 hypothetical protein IFM61606_00752 [Aspergillus udagawae]
MSPTPTEPIPRGSVEVALNFFEPPVDGSPPFQYAQEPPPGQPASNYTQPTVHASLTDIRGQESKYNLDHDAFQCLQSVQSLSEIPYETFLADDQIKEIYYPAVERLLLEHVTGAHKVVVFHHVVRMDRPDNPINRRPLLTVHADQTPRAAVATIRQHIRGPEEVALLLRSRYRIINVWKPINGAVESSPLAFASGSSVDPADLVPIELRFPNEISESVGVKYNAKQRWLYWSGMENNECLLLKCSDSLENVPAVQVPHSAFIDPRSRPGAKPRESIEIRALVFG